MSDPTSTPITNPARLIEGGHCQGYGSPCANDCDEDKTLCDDCIDALELEMAQEAEAAYWEEFYAA